MKIQIYVKLPQYERQWCKCHFGDPCTFPPQSNINNVIRHFLKKRPANSQVETQRTNEIAINIPDSKAKDPQYYNYLTKFGKDAISEAINDAFTMQMFEDLTDIKMRGVALTKIVKDWMEANGIDPEQTGNVYQKFTRIKDSYRKYGVNISRGYKHEHPSKKTIK
ncbi:MAG: hypothetical protein LKE54_03605 [Prevotella sp.]|jgi:hypothetical protein|nr:hypothetical protein [Prevotella sp.]MCH3994132.1 hypothetical protein [Prevotella sp.]